LIGNSEVAKTETGCPRREGARKADGAGGVKKTELSRSYV